MGQTLSNGVYLPNEGERNCYAGLASNWQILNTAVGNIAEKAPLVHTHGNITNDGKVGTTANLPLITGTGGVVQAGAFGNQANTFCEGNDSRLSDARTPVAHTHTKSDVTDLFNSANTWTESNIFSKECSIYNSDNSGSVAAIKLRNSKAEVTSSGNVNSTQAISFADKNNFMCTRVMCGVYSASVVNRLLAAAKDTNGNSVETELQIVSLSNGTKAIFPTSDADVDLGNSAHRWKTLNGVNPGALSLPDLNNGIDISSYITHLDKVVNNYTPSANGWLSIRVKKTSLVHASLMIYQIGGLLSSCETDEFNISGTNLPVIANQNVEIYIYADVLVSAKFYPCQGNI